MSLNIAFLKNSFFSGIAHVVNVFFPLIYIPLVFPIIGIEKIGSIGVASAIATFFTILIDYGFNILGVQEIIDNLNKPIRLSITLSNILYTKLVLLISSTIIYLPIIFIFPTFIKEKELFLGSLAMILGQTITLNFFFQAKEEFLINSLATILSRIISLTLIFLLVKERFHYSYIPLYIGLGTLVSNFLTWIYVWHQGITFTYPRYYLIMKALKQGAVISFSNLAISSYMQGNIFFLRLFASETVVGYYNVFEKIVFGIRQLLSIFSNIIYPRLYKEYKANSILNKSETKHYFLTLYVFLGITLITVALFSKETISLLLPTTLPDFYNHLFRLFCIVPFIVSLNIYPYIILNISGQVKQSQYVVVTGAFLSVLLNLLLGYLFSINGIILSIILVESFITVSLRIKYNRLIFSL